MGKDWRKGSTEIATPKQVKENAKKQWFGKCKGLQTRAKNRKKRK